MQQQQHVAELVAHLPGGGVRALAGKNALQGERQAGDAIPQGAVVDIAAAGEVSGERIWLLPHLPAAAGEIVVPRCEGLPMKYPEALRQEQEQQQGRELLGTLELKA